jgi:uncharacterized protein with von Willebrand factor type A (vWA) domain
LLKATLVKSETDGAVFDLAFRLFFREEAERPESLKSDKSGNPFGTGVDGSGTGKAGMGAASRELYEAVRKGQAEHLVKMIEKQLTQLEINDGGEGKHSIGKNPADRAEKEEYNEIINDSSYGRRSDTYS